MKKVKVKQLKDLIALFNDPNLITSRLAKTDSVSTCIVLRKVPYFEF